MPLVLGRNKGEQVIIQVPGRDQPIIVTLVDCRSHDARIGIEAERDVVILRKELIESDSTDSV